MIEEGKKKVEYIVNCETEEGQLGTSQQYQYLVCISCKSKE
jgi:hypothetical protein